MPLMPGSRSRLFRPPRRLNRKFRPGRLFAWGYNGNGEMGIGVTSAPAGAYYAKSSPVQVGALATWTYVVSGWNIMFGRTTDGKLFRWGTPEYAAGINRSSPTQLGSLTSWSNMSSATRNASAGIVEGTAYYWGEATIFYPVAAYNYRNFTPPTQVVGGRTDWQDLNVSAHFRSAIRNGGKLYTWGENDWGQLGQGNYTQPGKGTPSPTQIGSTTNWLKLGRHNNLTAFALDSNRQLWAWGANDNGETGNGGLNDTITGLGHHIVTTPTKVVGNQTWSFDVSSTYNHVAALDMAGHLWVWGYNGYGQLGFGDYVTRNVPTQLGTRKWKSVAAGRHFTLGITNDGKLWSWGLNVYGRLGLGDIINRSSPTQVGTGTNWISCWPSQWTAFAIRR